MKERQLSHICVSKQTRLQWNILKEEVKAKGKNHLNNSEFMMMLIEKFRRDNLKTIHLDLAR